MDQQEGALRCFDVTGGFRCLQKVKIYLQIVECASGVKFFFFSRVINGDERAKTSA